MFLGPSGTGKSTHARLWLQYIDSTELVNDDNPVVRIYQDGEGLGAINFGKMLALNESAAWLWQQAVAMDGFTIDTLAQKLCDEYEVSLDEAKTDVAAIIDEWQKVGVIE